MRPGGSRAASFLAAAIMVAVSLSLSLVAAELILRALAGDEGAATDTYRSYSGYYTNQPGDSLTVTNDDGRTNTMRFDRLGLRNPEGAAASADVVVLGDSFIAAVNTGDGATLVDWLRAGGIRAYNAGVNGMSTYQQVTLLRDHLAGLSLRTVLVGFYLGNDFRDNLFSSFPPPAAGEAEPGASRSGRRWRDLAADVCRRSALCRLVHARVWLGLVVGQQNDPMASYALAEMAVLRHADPRVDAMVGRTREALAELRRVAETRGLRVLMFGIPSPAQVTQDFADVARYADDSRAEAFARETMAAGYSWDNPDRRLAALCAELDLAYVSLLAEFRNRSRQERLYYERDRHWTDRGQKVAADRLIAALRNLAKQ